MDKGEIVRSLKGRDKDKVYLVYEVLDKDFVKLVNGQTKKIDNPKKKRIKHIEVVGKLPQDAKQNLLDSDIKKICKSYQIDGGQNA